MSNAKRAIIVIDVQNEYFTGDLPVEYPNPQQSLSNIGRVLDFAETQGIPVVIARHLAPEDSPLFARGSEAAELHPGIIDRPRALYIEKTMASCFTGTELATWIDAQQIDTLTIVGYMTHNCNDSTIKHAHHQGLAVEYLNDATGSVPYRNSAGAATAEEIHRIFTVVLQSNFAAVVSTDEWIDAVRNGTELTGDNVFASNQRARGLSN